MALKRLAQILRWVVWVLLGLDILMTLLAPAWIVRIVSGQQLNAVMQFLSAGGVKGSPVFLASFSVYTGLVLAAILFEMTVLLGSVVKGKPFDRKNAGCLRLAAYLTFAFSIGFLVKEIVVPSLSSLIFMCVGLVGGLVLVVLSMLFSLAAKINEENELTI